MARNARYLLDSDVCIDALRQSRPAVRAVNDLRAAGLAISVVSYGEVMDGVLRSRDRNEALARWSEFLADVTVLDVTILIAQRWAELRGSLRMQGLTVGDNDLIVAATGLRFGMTLVTRNLRHFARVPALEVRPLEG